jgi:putative transposase
VASRHPARDARRSDEEVEVQRGADCVRAAAGESGTPVVDVCRQIGVSEATYYTWKKKYADLGVTELRRLKMLEDENARLKRIVADLTLDKQILQEVVKKKL